MQVGFGKFTGGKRKGQTYQYDIPENTPDAKRNEFVLGKQGTGKTNLLMLKIFHHYTLYKKTNGKFGTIPVIFSPLFEYAKMGNKTNLDVLREKMNTSAQLPPDTQPVALDAVQYSFGLSEVPEYLKDKVQIVSFDFEDLRTEDIAVFVGAHTAEEQLGKIEKVLELLRNKNGKVSLDAFLAACNSPKSPPLFDGLYYTFKRLKQSGLFSSEFQKFDWYTALRNEKPIVFNFGRIDDQLIYQALGGVLLRKLFDLSGEYNAAVDKRMSGQKLNEREQWLAEHFVIGLFFEEAHQFFPPTTTRVLTSFPAHREFRKIAIQLGRKRGFKYNVLISQRLDLVYNEFRTEYDGIYIGSRVDFTDKRQLFEVVRQVIPDRDVAAQITMGLCKNDRFEWAYADLHKLSNLEPGCVRKFRSFLAPCGQ